MKLTRQPGMIAAIGMAVLMHVLLFTAAKPSNGISRVAEPAPPRTIYAAPSSEGDADMITVRMVKSPAVFAMPSGLGFSRELQQHDVQNRKTITPLPVRSEQFHDIAYSMFENDEYLNPGQLMVSSTVREPGLPNDNPIHAAPQTAAKRVQMAPELVRRLMGGVVLPPDLNKPTDKPWSVLASVSISEQGAVEHVFLDKPLESASLNQQLLHVLYSLRFKPGKSLESRIEIYSPDTISRRGAVE